MKKLTSILALAAAVALSGCASVVELADPATQYDTIEKCQERDSLIARGTVLEVVTSIIGAAADVALVPLATAKSVVTNVAENAYGHTTAVRNDKCAELRRAAEGDPPDKETQ